MGDTLIPTSAALCKIGLSPLAVETYEFLSGHSAITASVLAKALNRPRTSIYRVLNLLTLCGFVVTFRGASGSTYFSAVQLTRALPLFHAKQRQSLDWLIIDQQIANKTFTPG